MLLDDGGRVALEIGAGVLLDEAGRVAGLAFETCWIVNEALFASVETD